MFLTKVYYLSRSKVDTKYTFYGENNFGFTCVVKKTLKE